ncbi:MAG TPA: hypothetical protein VIG30_05110, partial [Ktedonobacterales bacterium]
MARAGTEQDSVVMLARVVVLSGARGRGAPPAFTYAVPDALAERLAPGQLVLVPFGPRLAPGVVWEVDLTPLPPSLRGKGEPEAETPSGSPPSTSETAETPSGSPPPLGEGLGERLRPIRELVDAAPLLGPAHRALVEWLADHYACSLASAAALMLPPGLLRGTRVLLRPAEASEGPDVAPAAADEAESGGAALEGPAADVMADADVAVVNDRRTEKSMNAPQTGYGQDRSSALQGRDGGPPRDETALLGALRARGRLDERALADALGARRAQAAVAALVAGGAAQRTAEMPSLAGGQRQEQWLRLVASADALAAWRTAARAELSALPRTVPASGAGVPGRQRASAGPQAFTERPYEGADLPATAGQCASGGQRASGGRPDHGQGSASARQRDRQGERRAERLLRQLAVLDVLGRPPAPARGVAGTVGAALGAWRLREVRRLTRATSPALDELVAAGLVAVETVASWHDPLAGRAIAHSTPLPLTDAQAAALAAILAPRAPDDPGVVLLHGITGSGKTEVYLQALAAGIAAGQRGIV